MTIIRMREIGACYRKYFPETIKKRYSIQWRCDISLL